MTNTKTKVIILYEDTLKWIFVNNVSIEKIFIIQEKPIEEWFITSGNWGGLLVEIQRIVRDQDPIYSFEFYGTQKYKNQFIECINKYDLGDCVNTLSENDIKKIYMKKAEEYKENDCDTEAFNFYKIVADYGKSEEAQFIIAEKYLEDDSNKDAIAKAIDYYKRAASQGYAKAQYKLYFLFSQGEYVKENRKEAIKWLMEAAKGDYTDAQVELGYCYEYGKGIEKSDKLAIEWYQKSAQQGNSEGKRKLRFRYENIKQEEEITHDDVEKITMKRAEKSLRKEVNKFDKIVMRSIRQRERPIIPYQTEHDEWQIRYDDLAELITSQTEIYILKLNGLSSEIDKFFTKKGNPKKKSMSVDDKLFREHSIGFGKTRNEYRSTKSVEFKIRFVSLVNINIIGYMDDIVDGWYEFNKDPLHEWELKEGLLESVIWSDTDAFTASYLKTIYEKGVCYGDELMTIHQNFAIIDQDYNVEKGIRILIKHSEELLKGTFKEHFYNRMEMPSDIIMDTIVKLALILTTKTSKVWKEKLFSDNCKFNDKCVPDIIMELGKHIICTDKSKIHILYQIFRKCRPLFRTRFKNLLDNENFVYGCNAIVYVGFIFNDKNVWDCIDRMLG